MANDQNRGTRVILFAHGGYENHGCEAIVLTTSQMVQKELPEADIWVASLQKEKDERQAMPLISRYLAHPTMKRWSPSWAFWHLMRNLQMAPLTIQAFLQKSITDQFDRQTIALSIGGDNYCYRPPYWLYAIDAAAKKARTTLVLWGASIEPKLIDDTMLRDLSLFDLIVTRESISYSAIKQKLSNAPVHLYPDPAFTLTPKATALPVNWNDRPVIGINISPLLLRYEQKSGIALQAAAELIAHIINTGKYSVALIPHVLINNNNDLDIMRLLFGQFAGNRNLFLFNGKYTASEYKYIISQCHLFIGARTHATIAAYSSTVPPLVIGYSVKSRGIAKDIFGDENTVLSIQDMQNTTLLIRKFQEMEERHPDLKKHLAKVMPDHIERSASASSLLGNLLNAGSRQ